MARLTSPLLRPLIGRVRPFSVAATGPKDNGAPAPKQQGKKGGKGGKKEEEEQGEFESKCTKMR